MYKFRPHPLFNADGDPSAASSAAPGAPDTSTAPSVAAGGQQEPPGTGNAPAPTTTNPDITTQESFATRLKEERSKIVAEFAPLQTHSQYLEKMAKLEGFADVPAYLKAIDEFERQKQIKDEATRLGVTEDHYQKFLQPVNDELKQTKDQLQTIQQREVQRQIDAEVTTLKGQYPDFEQRQKEVFDLAIQKGYTLEDAYILLTHKGSVEAARKQAEQDAIARITGRDQNQPISTNDKPSNTKLDPATMSHKDIAEISRRVQNGERITF